jgi:hypothetical protein
MPEAAGPSVAVPLGEHRPTPATRVDVLLTEAAMPETTTTMTEAERAADVIRSAAAWWRLAAERLEAGDLEQAADFAKLGRFGTEGMVERIETCRTHEATSRATDEETHR